MSSLEIAALFVLADQYFAAGQYGAARNIYSEAAQKMPDEARAIEGMAYCAANLGDDETAFTLLKQAVDAVGISAQGLYFLASFYLEKHCYDKAITCLQKSIQIAGEYFEALHDLGAAYASLGDASSAFIAYKKTLAYKNHSLDIYLNLGDLAMTLQRVEEAKQYYFNASTIDQSSAYAWSGYGAALAKLGEYEDALRALNRAIEHNPDLLDVWMHRGDIFNLLKRHDLALESYEKAEKIFPDMPFILGKILHQKMLACDWSGYEELIGKIQLGISQGKNVAEPFGFQAISESEEELKACAKLFADFYFEQKDSMAILGQNNKIKIGYVCGEFRNQATSILMAGVYESQNKDEFEIYAFDNGLDDGSFLRKRIEVAFDHMIDIRGLPDQEVAQKIANLKIDILVNLNGYFGESRQAIFAYRPAPIQVNYLGFPGTLGSKYIDYLIADDRVIPPDSYQYYYEKIVSLPNCYQANDDKRVISQKIFTRADFGLPQNAFVYCCFNNNYKITPQIFKIWMNILSNTSNTVLWLLKDNDLAAKNLLAHAEHHGVAKDRIFFADRRVPEEHLARHQHADLFLDTFPYNAHTTASDALWSGLPILTYVGNTFPGRVTSSLLSGLGVRELIADSQEEYRDMAISFANNPLDLRSIRKKIESKKFTCTLFDTGQFTKKLESAFRFMHSRCVANLPPEHFKVQ
ncbi:putative O-linked N-acetylglucosamine transferase, SPINDLY family [Polynucleobacter duraquae]|uniref:protein O-GlcNAc transferase n=1 Tax=Polynucleobacter duraquae TaxID=1835254 RepID=A0A0E3V0B5_9BURK|nr:tetratricopeptide repeat protein [Polynucleobacter duraquae]AKD24453.1 putative O-linked N-acetylglucosamine transferase, SPINDLY family [Polynucleobacter duraquae]